MGSIRERCLSRRAGSLPNRVTLKPGKALQGPMFCRPAEAQTSMASAIKRFLFSLCGLGRSLLSYISAAVDASGRHDIYPAGADPAR
jgi:hypothetical protein